MVLQDAVIGVSSQTSTSRTIATVCTATAHLVGSSSAIQIAGVVCSQTASLIAIEIKLFNPAGQEIDITVNGPAFSATSDSIINSTPVGSGFYKTENRFIVNVTGVDNEGFTLTLINLYFN